LVGFHLPLPEMSVRVSPPFWALPEVERKRVGVLWDVNKQLMVVHRPEGMVALKGDGLEVEGRLQVSWDEDGVHVRPVEKGQKAKVGTSTMLRRKAWYSVVLPVALLTAIASRDTKALQEQEIIAMEGTITGVFLNAATNQFEMVSLPIPSSTEDYYFADEESYVLQAKFVSSLHPGSPTEQEFIISVSSGAPTTLMDFLLPNSESSASVPLK